MDGRTPKEPASCHVGTLSLGVKRSGTRCLTCRRQVLIQHQVPTFYNGPYDSLPVPWAGCGYSFLLLFGSSIIGMMFCGGHYYIGV